MNSAYKHLDAKLRIAELTVGQWIGAIIGIGLAIVWGYYLSPFGTTLTLTTAIYVAAIPIGAAFLASFSDVDPWLIVRSAIGWRRLEGRFVPGPGDSARGYVVREDHQEREDREAAQKLADLDLAALWKES